MDLLILRPDGTCKFVEVKRETGVLSEIQKFRIEQLKALNFEVEVVYGG